MTQIFNDNNNVTPVTLVKAGPCFVIQVKNKKKMDTRPFKLDLKRLRIRKQANRKKDILKNTIQKKIITI